MKANEHIEKVLNLADSLRLLAEEGFSCCEDEGCLTLNGLVRDCAFKLLDAARKERGEHVRLGLWPGAEEGAP